MSSGIETMTVWGERLEIFMVENLRCAIYLFVVYLTNAFSVDQTMKC
jgi:hypothetical protein